MLLSFRLLLLILVSGTLSFGQNKVSISALVAPMLEHTAYGRASFYPDSDGQVVEPVLIYGSKNAYGLAAGATVHYTYAPGWSVETGLIYRQLTIHLALPPTSGEGTTAIRGRAIRIPLLLSYQPTTKRLAPYFSIGALIDFPFSSRVIVNKNGQPTQTLRLDTSGGPVFYTLLGGGGVYRLSQRCSLIAQPVWSYNLGRLGGLNEYNPSYQLSLQAQFLYSL